MKKLSAALLIFFGLVSAALAQQTQDTLNGKECWTAGQGLPICSDLVRNSHAIVTYQITGNITIGTVNPAGATLSDGGYAMITVKPVSATVTLPSNPFPDGGLIAICNASGASWSGTAVIVVANVGQTAPTGVAANVSTTLPNECAKFIFYRATTTWYRVT